MKQNFNNYVVSNKKKDMGSITDVSDYEAGRKANREGRGFGGNQNPSEKPRKQAVCNKENDK